MAKWRTFNSFQALKLILQPDSDDELEVDHYESSNESVEDEDFAEDGPKISMRPIKMANWMTNLAPMMEVKKTVLLTFFTAPTRHVNNAADKQENISKREDTLIFYQRQMSCLCVASACYKYFMIIIIIVCL